MNIPNIPRPYDDELLYSWVYRMADDNGVPFPMFAKEFLNIGNAKMGGLPVDIRNGFMNLCAAVKGEDRMRDLYMTLSTFEFESVFMTPGQQTRYINNVFRPQDRLNPPVNRLYTTVKICPECLKEDMNEYGQAYLHRAHQLSGVHVCHKHGCRLLIYRGKRGHECELDPDDYEEDREGANLYHEKAYADYACAIQNLHLNTDILKIKDALYTRLKERGYSAADDYNTLQSDISKWEYKNLINEKGLPAFLKVKMITAKYITAREIIPVLMYLYPNVKELADRIVKDDLVLDQYICPECGRVYCATPQSQEDGWGCPYCEADIPEDKRLLRLIDKTGNGEYKPISEFRSLDMPMKFIHEACGSEVSIKPREFLYEGVRCMCENTITEQAAKEAIEAHPGYKLIEFHGTNEPVKIFHEECGNEFECNYYKFLQFPGCRYCNPPHMTAELYRERVKALVGDEYTIMEGFEDQHTKVTIQHNKCGCVQAYKPSAFLDGQRCKKCRKLIRHKDLEAMLKEYSNGRYEITEYDKNVCVVKDVQTGSIIRIPPLKIMQEIKRPTPSPILPINHKSET